MRAIAVYDAKNQFSEIIAAVELGEEFTITRHGTPVARLVAVQIGSGSDSGQRERVLGAMTDLRRLGEQVTVGCSVAEAIQTGRD